jgi:hypothetical protein
MTLADELGGPLIGATNKKPRLRKQPGFSSLSLREIILPNRMFPNTAPAAMISKAETASGDDDASSQSSACIQISTFLSRCLQALLVDHFPLLSDLDFRGLPPSLPFSRED